MKTAISLPDDLFQDGEKLARRLKKSRSQLYADALAEYIARHDPEGVTAEMDAACEEVGEEGDPFVARAARRILEQTEW